jgi:alginate O-acetyltransferase complex protein AlgI
LTMLLGGLWHGANWTFVAWGALHGAGLAIHKWMTERWPTPGILRRTLGLPITLLFVMVGWVFFRAPTFEVAAVMLQKMLFLDRDGMQWPYVQAILALSAAIGAHVWIARGGRLQFNFRVPVSLALLGFALVVDLLYAPSVHSPFIYFQF